MESRQLGSSTSIRIRRRLAVALVAAFVGGAVLVGCGDDDDESAPSGAQAVCDLNEDLEALNERTIPDIEDDPFPDAALLEENFVEGATLMRDMANNAPADIEADLAIYADWNDALSELYAEYGYDREAVWEAEPYTEEHELPEEARTRITAWFIEHCGVDLQG